MKKVFDYTLRYKDYIVLSRATKEQVYSYLYRYGPDGYTIEVWSALPCCPNKREYVGSFPARLADGDSVTTT